MTRHKKAGFTLIEISIVLVIVGLLVGTVFVARDLISTAQSRSQISDWDKYTAAVIAFKLKYDCLPGDCRNASTFITGAQNGDGNGFLQTGGTSSPSSETYSVFYHLNRAGMIEIPGYNGSYWIMSSADVGITLPAMKTDATRPWFYMEPTPWNPSNNCTGASGTVPKSKNYITTGAVMGAYGEIREQLYQPPYSGLGYSGYGAMSTQQALYIDSKIDDGMPKTGKMLSTSSLSSGYPCYHQTIDISSYCVNSSNSQYNTTYTATSPCSPMIAAGF